MFKKNDKLDYENLNVVIDIIKKILRIGFIFLIIALIFLITILIKELHILSFIKELLVVISPIFIGLIIAWLFDPVVKYLVKKGIPKIVSCIIIYLLFIGTIILCFYLLMPSFISQIKDFIGTMPSILHSFKDFINNIFYNFHTNHGIDLSFIKNKLFESIETFGIKITTNLPNNLIVIFKSLVNGGMTLLLGLMIGFICYLIMIK